MSWVYVLVIAALVPVPRSTFAHFVVPGDQESLKK